MSWRVAKRNGVSLGLAAIISLTTTNASPNPGPPWIVALSDGTAYTVDTIVLNSSGTSYTTVDSVKSSSGTTYFPI